MTKTMWTLAYRKRTANRFQRVANWQGTWHQAVEASRLFAEENPDLQVWYVPTAASDANGAPEDAGNVMVDSGKRIRIRENGALSDAVIAGIPSAREAEARWLA